MSNAPCKLRHTDDVLSAVASFCDYYRAMNRFVAEGRIRSSVDRGAFVRPHDLLPKPLLDLLGESRNSRSYAYGPERGDRALRELVAEIENIRHGTAYDADEVVIVPGAWAGVELALEELFDLRRGRAANGRLAVIGPTHYQLLHRAINFLGVEVLAWDFVVDPASPVPRSHVLIDEILSCSPRAVFLTNPSNPDAVYLPADFVRALVERCEAAGVYVLIDEIQDFLPSDDAAGLGYGSWVRRPHVLRVDSYSKKRALAEYRIGWLIGDRSVIGDRTSGVTGRMSGLMGNAPRAANTLVHTLLQAERSRLQGGGDVLASAWEDLRARERWLLDRLRTIPGVSIDRRDACINLCVRVAGVGSDMDLATELMRAGTLMMPCVGYGHLPESRKLRITFAERWEKLEHAMDCLETVVSRQ